LVIEFAYNAFGTYDYQAAIATLRLSNQLYPNNASNWANLCNLYTQLGDYPQAVAAGESAWRLGPQFGPRAEILARAYKRANRFAEAKRVAAIAVASGKDTFGLHSILFQIAIAEHDTARKKAEGEWGFTHEDSDRAREDLGQAAATEGKLQEAAVDFSRARQDAARAGESDFADSLAIELAEILADAGDAQAAIAALKGQAGNGSDSGRFAVLKAELGDPAPARKFLAEAGSSEVTDTIHRYYDLPMVRALLALDALQPAQAVQELEPARPYQMRDFKLLSLRARAEAEAGMLDRAADDYRLILANQGIDPIAPLYNVAHLRLARVLVLQKKYQPARAEYQAFLDAWKDADPHLPLLLQAKKEYSELAVH
jgi:tetratricopeptide (TPR) repeat protein